MHHASSKVKAKIAAKGKRLGEQHGPVDDMPNSAAAAYAPAPMPETGRLHLRHHAQMGSLRALGGKQC